MKKRGKEYEPYSQTVETMIDVFYDEGPLHLAIGEKGGFMAVYSEKDLDDIPPEWLEEKVESFEYRYIPKDKMVSLILYV